MQENKVKWQMKKGSGIPVGIEPPQSSKRYFTKERSLTKSQHLGVYKDEKRGTRRSRKGTEK